MSQYGTNGADPMPNLPHPDGYDPFEEKGQNPNIAKQRRLQERKFRAYKKSFDHDEGRFVLKDLMAVSYYHGLVRPQESSEVLGQFELGRREGRRELFFAILNNARANLNEIDKIKLVEMK